MEDIIINNEEFNKVIAALGWKIEDEEDIYYNYTDSVPVQILQIVWAEACRSKNKKIEELNEKIRKLEFALQNTRLPL